MVMKVSKSHFKAHALELLRRVEATGEPLIITDRGRPVLEVRPYREEDPRETLRGTLLRYEGPPSPQGRSGRSWGEERSYLLDTHAWVFYLASPETLPLGLWQVLATASSPPRPSGRGRCW
jgi:prevent-host-death family protein